MADQQLNRLRVQGFDDGVPPPPRFLLWATIGLFLLLVISAVIGFIVLQSRPALSELFGLAIVIVPIVVVISITAAIVFRKRLPRRFALWLTVLWIALGVMGGLTFILVFRNALAPGQRETVKHYLPFMEMFAPPLPAADSSLPTPIPNQAGNISAEDLLSGAPLGIATPQTQPTQPAVAPAQPSATATTQPTVTAQPTAMQTATVSPTQAAIVLTNAPQTNSGSSARPIFAQLGGITPVKQGWNNCGPANITMALSYYGWTQNQDYALTFLKPDREDKNVSPWEMAAFVNEQSQVRALYRVGGDMELIKQFLSNKLPVIVETGYLYEGSDWLGHYQTVVGYDDTQGAFYVYDSYLGTGEDGRGLPKLYAEFDAFWENFNRIFIVLYKPDEETLVRSLLGERADVNTAFELAAEAAKAEARANPQNGYAWYNLGSSLTKLGSFEQAAAAFDKARQVGNVHWRMTLYQFEIFEAYFNVGRYDELMALVDANLNNNGQYVEETHYWKGKALAAEGQIAEATAAFRQALVHNPRYTAAQDALNALPK